MGDHRSELRRGEAASGDEDRSWPRPDRLTYPTADDVDMDARTLAFVMFAVLGDAVESVLSEYGEGLDASEYELVHDVIWKLEILSSGEGADPDYGPPG